MKKKRDWRQELNNLDIQWEERGGKVYLDGYDEPVSLREVYKRIQNYQNDKSWKKDLKNFHHRYNRRATKDKLNKGRFDDILQNDYVKEDDPWSWD